MCNDGTDGYAMQRWNCVEAQHSMAMERNRAYLSTLSHSPFEFINNFVVVLFLIRLMNSTFLDTYCMRNISNYCRCLWTEQMYFFFSFRKWEEFFPPANFVCQFSSPSFCFIFGCAHSNFAEKNENYILFSLHTIQQKRECFSYDLKSDQNFFAFGKPIFVIHLFVIN